MLASIDSIGLGCLEPSVVAGSAVVGRHSAVDMHGRHGTEGYVGRAFWQGCDGFDSPPPFWSLRLHSYFLFVYTHFVWRGLV